MTFSGSSAFSTRSLRFARMSVLTRSSNAMVLLLFHDVRSLRRTFVICCLKNAALKKARSGIGPTGRVSLAFFLVRGFFGLVADLAYLAEQILHLHTAQCLEERGHLCGHFRHVAGDLVHSGGTVVAGAHDGDLIHLAERRGHRTNDFGQLRDELIYDSGLVVLLIGLGLDVHGLGFGFAFLEDDLSFRLALRTDGAGAAFGL